MALGFGPLSSEPLDSLPHFSVFFDQEVFFLAQLTDPVFFLTGDPLKRLVFAVEISVLPFADAVAPVLGDEM